MHAICICCSSKYACSAIALPAQEITRRRKICHYRPLHLFVSHRFQFSHSPLDIWPLFASYLFLSFPISSLTPIFFTLTEQVDGRERHELSSSLQAEGL